MATIVNAPGGVNVRVNADGSSKLVASSPWGNGEQVERSGSLVSDGSYDWQYCIRAKNRNNKGWIRSDFLSGKYTPITACEAGAEAAVEPEHGPVG